jgi:hypothetical protein
MSKSKAKAEDAKAENAEVLTSGGVAIASKVVTGEETKLSAKEQGQLARGEIDEKGKPTGKKPHRKPGDVKTVKVKYPLYQGKLTCTADAAATGEEVSVVMVVAEPTTEDGVFYHFQQYHPSAIRDTFKIDPTNTDDPTKRTYLERP